MPISAFVKSLVILFLPVYAHTSHAHIATAAIAANEDNLDNDDNPVVTVVHVVFTTLHLFISGAFRSQEKARNFTETAPPA